MKMLSPTMQGYLLAFGATLLWSTVFLLARILAGTVTPVELSLGRWGLAFVFILPFTWRSTWASRKLVLRHTPYLFVCGLVGFSIFSVLVFRAGHTTEATNLSLIAASAPVFMALFSRVFLGDRLTARQVVGLGIAVCGVLVLVLRGDISRLLTLSFTVGDLWMLMAASLFAAYSVLMRKRPLGIPQGAALTAMLGYGALALVPSMGVEMAVPGWQIPGPAQWFGIVFMAILPSLVGYYCWNLAVERIGPVRAGIVYYSIPLFSSLEASWILQEVVTLPQIAGGGLIIGGIVYSTLDALRRK